MIQKGILEIICGSMFSGKTEELIRRIKRAEIAKQKVKTFKHSLDKRKSSGHVVISHNGVQIKALPINNPIEIPNNISEETAIIGIDEVQFFSDEIIPIIMDLVNKGKRVIVSGLDLDFRGRPMGCVPTLLALADKVTKLKAICIQCGKEATLTQRLIKGKPAKYDDPIVLIGAEECYEARCRNCHMINKPNE